MGLLDQVIGSVVGSRAGGASGGMSGLTKALLVLLAAKAAHGYFGQGEEKSGGAAAPGGGHAPPVQPSGKVESGILAGLPSLDSLLSRLKASGHEETAKSWVEPGPNKAIAPHDLEKSLGRDTIDKLQSETGMPRDQLLRELSEALPSVVDKLTPQGRLPTEAERAKW